ncbi:MAG TPA: arylamine N-acetyltransferase [Polyangiaceae bacterium]|jgi:N-hydroxyarylamine O-acetyltransferase|nr:arylamine N-acetyltransferase [Polyangiaceae bacterium]
MDLAGYAERIRYAGPLEPTLSVLHALTAAHAEAIPFENLDVLLGRPIDLADEGLFDKLVRRRRGGYCFEQNGLFLRVLEAIGFSVTPLSARVRLDRPRDYLPPRTHVFLRVVLDGESWLTDVGVGGVSLTAAIRLDADGEQATPHESRRIVREDHRWFHQARFGTDWVDVYEFTREPMPPIDREVANWFTSAHPASHFKNRLIAARAGRDGRRFTLLNDQFKVRERDGRAVSQTIATAAELLAVLAEQFELHFPEGTRFGAPGSPWPVT